MQPDFLISASSCCTCCTTALTWGSEHTALACAPPCLTHHNALVLQIFWCMGVEERLRSEDPVGGLSDYLQARVNVCFPGCLPTLPSWADIGLSCGMGCKEGVVHRVWCSCVGRPRAL